MTNEEAKDPKELIPNLAEVFFNYWKATGVFIKAVQVGWPMNYDNKVIATVHVEMPEPEKKVMETKTGE